VLSLYAKGLTTGGISAHFAEIYGASASRKTISRITDKGIEEMNDWSVRPLDATYAAIFIDAIVIKVRDGQVANWPFYAAIGVTLGGDRDILGLWAGTGGEGAKFWMGVLTDLKNRGVKDTFFLVCDGLKGLPEAVSNIWPQAIVQTCIIHLIRNTFRLTFYGVCPACKHDWREHAGGAFAEPDCGECRYGTSRSTALWKPRRSAAGLLLPRHQRQALGKQPQYASRQPISYRTRSRSRCRPGAARTAPTTAASHSSRPARH